MNQMFVFLPCYNEAGNIGALIDGWLSLNFALQEKGYKLCVYGIDDKSTDQTKEIIASYSERNSQVKLLAHRNNTNLGGGLRTAFCWFDHHGKSGDVCVIMDGDNTHDPKYILNMLEILNDRTDCVIASRYQKGADVYGVPVHRRLLSDGARLFYTMLLHVPNVHDYTCGYRVYKYDIIHKARTVYKNNFVQNRTFSCMLEILYKLYLLGAEFDEVAFSLRYDKKQGESKMRVFKTLYDSVRTAFQLKCKR